jgi:hypothetical protein
MAHGHHDIFLVNRRSSQAIPMLTHYTVPGTLLNVARTIPGGRKPIRLWVVAAGALATGVDPPTPTGEIDEDPPDSVPVLDSSGQPQGDFPTCDSDELSPTNRR